MRDVVAFQQGGQDAAGAEGVGFERDEDQDGRGEGVVRSEELEVEVRDEVTREIHGRRNSNPPRGRERERLKKRKRKG